MKQTYTKPTLRVECFSMTQNIATHCGWTDEAYVGRPTHAEKTTCGWAPFPENDSIVYWTSPPACSGYYSENLVGAEVCYNAPNGQAQIFAS